LKLEESINEKDENCENISINEREQKHDDEDDKYDPAEANDETDEEIVEDDNQDCPNDNESNEISLTEGDDNILEECNENENDKDESPTKILQTSPRNNQRSVYNQRARGNRARRSRR
jgi:hypothetical protein